MFNQLILTVCTVFLGGKSERKQSLFTNENSGLKSVFLETEEWS